MYIVTKVTSYGDTAERFSHSVETITRRPCQTLESFILVHPTVVSLLEEYDSIWTHYQHNYRFQLYSRDCFESINEIYMDFLASAEEKVRFRVGKGHLYQNILAARKFDIKFFSILAGWEGSAHNGRWFRDAQLSYNLKALEVKYWSEDAG